MAEMTHFKSLMLKILSVLLGFKIDLIKNILQISTFQAIKCFQLVKKYNFAA